MGTDRSGRDGVARPAPPEGASDLGPLDRFQHLGVEVAVRRAGDAGPGVVLLHNGGTSHTIWRHQIADLARDHRVVAVDLPGFGASPRPGRPLTLDDLAQLVTALVDHDGLTPAILVGNCMGSAIAARVAAQRARDVRALVLVNPLTADTFRAGGLGLLTAGGDRGATLMAPLRDLARRVRLPRKLAEGVLRYQLGPAGVRAGVHRDPELTSCVVRPDQIPALTDVLEDLTTSYHIVRGADGPPLLTIWGARNRVLSPRVGAQLDQQLRPDRRVLVRETGHLPMLERPDQVTGAIRSFLGEAAATDAAGAAAITSPAAVGQAPPADRPAGDGPPASIDPSTPTSTAEIAR